ncbi:MAG: nucleoside hydrolase [Erysipelotrichaceae bacterium]|nr:nucleoside hydrolase [Erysipelotrichaceae bacterium]
MEKRKVIFDCDIGCDDAVALIALLLSENVEVMAITCVKGNVGVKDVVNNALKVSHLCKKDIPVYEGCSEPMVRDLLKGREHNTLMQRVKMEIDGKQILIHDPSFPLPLPERKVEEKHACSYIIDTLRNTKEKIDICAVGPLTNIAMALRLDPTIVNNIETIYIMGGGLYIGNRTPLAEANFYDDPEAAEIVLTSGAHIVLCPIEACEMGGTYDQKDLQDIKDTDNKIADFLYEELQGYINRCNILFKGDVQSCCVYDYVAVAPLIDESIIAEMHRDVAHVDISAGMADGQLVIDRRGMFKAEKPIDIIYKADADKLHKILLDLLKNK